MPKTATQKKPLPAAKPQAKPVSKPEPAETPDHEYALVSVLYHALQGVQACEQYIDDAERAGKDELVAFFTEARDEQTARATRAKQLLLGREDDEDDDEDDDDEEEDEDDEEA